MQRKLFPLTLLSFISISTLSVCKPSSKVDNKQQTTIPKRSDKTERCNQTITYHADKLSAQEHEADADVNIVINPTTKVLTLNADIPSAQQKITFDVVIETIDCHLNADLTEGYSIYRGYYVKQNDNSEKAELKLEAKDGKLKLYNGVQTNDDAIEITKWTAAQ